MFHLALYDAAIAVNATLTQLANVADPVVATSGSGFLVNPSLPNMMRVAGVGNILNRAQLQSGSIRKYLAGYDVDPVNIGTLIGSPARAIHLEDSPFPLVGNEELDAFVSNSAVTSTRTSVAVWFCDGPIRPVNPNNMFSAHWTATSTLVANAWNSITPVFDNGLPSGTFIVIGSRAQSAGGLFHRYIPRNNNTARPGTFCGQTLSDYGLDMDRAGNLGEWFRFTNTTLPTIEVFSRSADTAEEGVVDLVQVG